MIEAVGDSAALVGREMRHLRRVPAKLFGVTIVPIIFVAVFGYLLGSAMKVPNGNYREFIMAGIFAQVMLSGVTNTAIGVATDLQNGLVDRFRSLPISRSAVLVSRTISDLLLGIISSALMGIVGYWMGWRVREGFLKLLAGFALLVLLGIVFLAGERICLGRSASFTLKRRVVVVEVLHGLALEHHITALRVLGRWP